MKKFKFLKNKKIYYMHINKTGGTYVSNVLSKTNKPKLIKQLGHHSNTLDIPRENFFFFTFREPFEKMCSSSYHLFRNLDEKVKTKPLFKHLTPFNHAEEFISSLCDSSSKKHSYALDIYNTFPHVSKSYWSFFLSKEYLKAVSPRILLSLETDNLDNTLQNFLTDLNIKIIDENFNSSSNKNVSSNIKNYRSEFGEKKYLFYKKLYNIEYDFYDFAKTYTERNNRYHLTLERYFYT